MLSWIMELDPLIWLLHFWYVSIFPVSHAILSLQAGYIEIIKFTTALYDTLSTLADNSWNITWLWLHSLKLANLLLLLYNLRLQDHGF